MDRVKIRMASEPDALTLARLRYEFRSLFHEVREDEAAFIDRCTVWMRERLRSESLWKCWIAELQDTVVGDVWIQLVEKIPNPIEESEYYIYLTNFYVRKQYRSHGVGSMLLSQLLDWVKKEHQNSDPLAQRAQQVVLYPPRICDHRGFNAIEQ